MMKTAEYSATERLRDGRTAEIRALKQDDHKGLVDAVGRSSPASLYRRFFAPKRHFSEKEVDFFLNVDFKNHVALVATVDEGGRAVIVAGGRYIVQQPGEAEVAFAVIDEYQGKGLGAALMRHLVKIAREAGLKKFIAEVLPDNVPMLKVFEKSGLKVTSKRGVDATHVALELG